jgi:hypothetical protein
LTRSTVEEPPPDPLPLDKTPEERHWRYVGDLTLAEFEQQVDEAWKEK